VTDRLRKALTDAEQGIRPVSQQLTTADYLKDWLATVKETNRPRTHASYADTVERYIPPSIGTVALAKLQPEHITAMLRDVRRDRPNLSATTIRYAYTVLRIALGRAVKMGKAHRNVATLIDPPARVRPTTSPMTAEQTRTLLVAVRGDPLEPLYRLAVATGLRQGELLALRWEDVDLEEGLLHVRHTLQVGTRALADPKTEQAKRTIALDDETVALLRAHKVNLLETRLATRRKDGGFLFVG
jgi:integrase